MSAVVVSLAGERRNRIATQRPPPSAAVRGSDELHPRGEHKVIAQQDGLQVERRHGCEVERGIERIVPGYDSALGATGSARTCTG